MGGPKATQFLWQLSPQVVQDFAGVRGHVQNVVKASPRSVSFEEALKQVQLSLKEAPKR